MLVGYLCGYLVSSAVSRYDALVDDDYPVAYRLYLGKYVRREDNGVVLAELLDESAYLDYLVRVKSDSGLIKNEHGRIVDECLCETDSLLVAL